MQSRSWQKVIETAPQLTVLKGSPIKSFHAIQRKGDIVIRSNPFSADEATIYRVEDISRRINSALDMYARSTSYPTETGDAYDVEVVQRSDHGACFMIDKTANRACLEISGLPLADFEAALGLKLGFIKVVTKSALAGTANPIGAGRWR